MIALGALFVRGTGTSSSTADSAVSTALVADSARSPEKQERASASTAGKQMARPVQIVIPAIGVSARVVPLGLNPDHTLEVPTNLADTGWFTRGPEPGERGAAVVVGHVASLSGRGVFYNLRSLRAGDLIEIRLRDGTVVTYRAGSSMVVSKSRFPTKLVYAETRHPTLRLITCSGKLDPATGHHPANRIVFASYVGEI